MRKIDDQSVWCQLHQEYEHAHCHCAIRQARGELAEPPCYVCGSYFCPDFDYCDPND